MKKIVTLLVCGLFVPHADYACGPYEHSYLPENYFTYRVYGDNYKNYNGYPDLESYRRADNCRAWAATTSTALPLEDIEDVVYRWSIESTQTLLDLIGSQRSCTSSNQFARWLVEHKDKEALDFLLLAKTCERTRSLQNSSWYYPTEGDDISTQLDRIVTTASHYSGKRFQDRYTLQALRALFASRQYGECINLWERKQKFFKQGALRDMATDYIGGCYVQLKQNDKAAKFYLAHNQVTEACRYTSHAGDPFDWIYANNPDTPWLLEQIEQKIFHIERWSGTYVGDEDLLQKDVDEILPKVQRICRERRCQDMAPWYYTLAFLEDRSHHEDNAWKHILLAEQTVRNKDMADAIRLLKIMIRARRTKKYNPDFENYLYGELVWLDGKIKENLDQHHEEQISLYGSENQISGFSQYYWNDMMRKILISRVAPLCIRSNYPTRALQYLNMADNRIFQLVEKRVVFSPFDEDYEANSRDGDYEEFIQKKTFIRWDDYRMSEKFVNNYDYQNDLFINIDSLGVGTLQRLTYRMAHPQCPLDTFLNERSYTDPQYFNEIIGTQLIAQMRYGEAEKYLQKVSGAFNRSRNVYEYCRFDPFTAKKTGKKDEHYKLHFAQKMAALEQEISQCKDPDTKAELLLQYARGMRNSFSQIGWPLTSYYWAVMYNFPFHSRYQRQMKQKGIERYEQIRDHAFTLFTDQERAAKAYYDWALFKSAVKRFPETQTAKFIQGHCDELKDYLGRPEKDPYEQQEEWMAENGYE